jgi:hypothetical protein
MRQFFLLYKAERIKLHWSWATALAVIAPFSQVLFLFIFYWFLEDRASPTGSGFIAWYQVNGNGWNLFFMPLTAALVAAISWDAEEMAGGRKHMFVQPCPNEFHYVAKLASHFSLMILSQLLFFTLLATGGILLRRYVPTLDMGTFEPKALFRLSGTSLLASFPLVTLHTWVSSKFKGLLTSMVFAVVGTWATSQMSSNRVFLHISPWGLATQSVAISDGGKEGVLGLLIAAFLCALILATFGTLDFRWRGKSFT